jgi:hypothetical protein
MSNCRPEPAGDHDVLATDWAITLVWGRAVSGIRARQIDEGPQRPAKLARTFVPENAGKVPLDGERLLLRLGDYLSARSREFKDVPATILLGGAAGDHSGLLECVEQCNHRRTVHAENPGDVLLRPRTATGDHSESPEITTRDTERCEGGIGVPLEGKVRMFEQVAEHLVGLADRSASRVDLL